MKSSLIELYADISTSKKVALAAGKIPAFCYDRVSSERQGREGLSLAYQEQGSGRYADRAGLYIVNQFTITESAFRGGNRKIFKQMIDAAARFDIKDLVFMNTDRMCRNYADWLLLDKIISEKNINIHFYQTGRIINKKSSYIENYIMDIEIADAKKHSKKISYDVININNFKAEKGIAPSKSPDGYIYDRQARRHIFDPERKMILQYIFDTFDSKTISVQQLADDLNRRGWKTTNGKDWRTSHLHYLLCSPFFAGKFWYHDEVLTGNQDTYITLSRYEDRLKRLGMKNRGGRKRDYEFSLAGMLTCEGKRLTGEIKKGKYIYYTNRTLNRSVREEQIFEWLDREIAAIQYSSNFSEYLKKVFGDAIEHQKRCRDSSRSAITRQINDLLVEIDQLNDKLVDAILSDEIVADAIKGRIKKNRQRIIVLEEDMKDVLYDKEDFVLKMSDIISEIHELPSIYSASSPTEKAKLLRDSVDAIVVDDVSGSVEIVWSKPFSFILSSGVMSYADTPPEVRRFPILLPESDDFRTLVDRVTLDARRYFAA